MSPGLSALVALLIGGGLWLVAGGVLFGYLKWGLEYEGWLSAAIFVAAVISAGYFIPAPSEGPRTLLGRQIELGVVDGRAGESSELFAGFLGRHGRPAAP